MIKLLHSGIQRLFKNKLLLICSVVVFALSLFAGGQIVRSSQKIYVDAQYFMEDILFVTLPYMAFYCATFVSLFLGIEYEQGTIRNKLLVGHTRASVYCSNLIVCIVASVIMLAVMLITGWILGICTLQDFYLEPSRLALVLLCSVLITVTFSAFATAVTMNISNRAICVVILFMLILGMLMGSAYLDGALSAQEMTYEYVLMTEAGMEYGDLIPNPNYVSGTKRVVYEFLIDLLPTGQASQITNFEFSRCIRWPVLSLAVIVVTSILGFIGFKKKDIK